jgi:CRP/FNR family transcriptional regulator, cyclic AMP receptor protein
MEGLVKSAKRQFDPLAFLAKVGTGKTILKYRKGRIIYAQGEDADQIYYIQSGKIKVTVVSEQGKEAVVGLLEAGQFFGEGCLNGQAVRIGTARAMEECLITSISRKAMLAALRREPKFAELFVTYLVTRSNRIEEDLIDQLFNSSEKRLARLLLLLANFGKDGDPIPIDASINQATLAEMIGTTRSRVSFFLNKFRKLGLISYNGNIEVHRSLLNAVLYESAKAREFIDFWIETSVHAAEQYGVAGGEQDVTQLARRFVQAAKGQGISEADMQAEIGDVAEYIRGKLKAANKAESDRHPPTN